MAEELSPPDVHDTHPSLAALSGKLDEAKEGLDEATEDNDYTQKRVETAKNLMSDDLRPFKNNGEKMFKVLYDGIGLYEDKELTEETFTVMLEKDTIIPGTYINDKCVLIGEPYNVYCSSINVEPTDITHSQYDDNKHEYDTTVIINVEDIDQDNNELDEQSAKKSDANSSNEYVVVDEQNNGINNHSSAGLSEFENINPSDAQSSGQSAQYEEIENIAPKIPPPAPEPPVNNESDEDIDESSHLLGSNDNNNNNNKGMPAPPLSPSLPSQPSTKQQQHYDYQNGPPHVPSVGISVGMPPPVPADAVISNNDNDNYIDNDMDNDIGNDIDNDNDNYIDNDIDNDMDNDYPEQKKMDSLQDMDDVKLVDDINAEYGGIGGVVPTTGNILEDLDNLLRIYRNLSNEKERELVYVEFWNKYEGLSNSNDAYLLLEIPSRVRGFLLIMKESELEPYKRDRIMIHVLSRNGLLEEPDYIANRYLFTYFIQFEIFNYMKWFCCNCGSVQSWMFFFLWLLMFAEIIHIGIDFGRGNPWRAILMECLVPLTFIASIQFVNTPFTANILRTMLENKCAALCTVYGRVSLNVLIIFFCLGSLELQDVFLLFSAFLCGVWTTIIFLSFSRLKHASNYVRIATGTAQKLREKFIFANENKDGILNAVELRNFFKSYNQIVPMWQIDLMISQYDVHRDGGLRFDSLRLWFEKVPINHITRINLLSGKPTDLYSKGSNGITTAANIGDIGGDGINNQFNQINPMTTSGGGQPQKLSEAEREWIGLAGKKYMNQETTT